MVFARAFQWSEATENLIDRQGHDLLELLVADRHDYVLAAGQSFVFEHCSLRCPYMYIMCTYIYVDETLTASNLRPGETN